MLYGLGNKGRLGKALVGGLCLLWAASPAMAQTAESPGERINKGTVGVISGGVNGTYIRIASDLAAVLDDGDNLRVLPVLGKGSVQNIADILYLKGMDIGIVQSDVLAFVKRENIHPRIETNIRYITKLYNEEFHLLAGKGITSVQDLAGQKVNFGVGGSGTYMTASIVFDKLGVSVEPVSFDQDLALEKVKNGEIAALVYVAGKPTQLFRNLTAESGVHFLPIPYSPELLETYLPSRLTNEDYPPLVQAGEPIETVAVGAVMAVYNWKRGTFRYGKVARFVEAFITRFDEFLKPPRHAKWKEVSLTAEVPGWTRFKPADDILKRGFSKTNQQFKHAFDEFLRTVTKSTGRKVSDADREALFQQFLRWQAGQN